MNSKLIKILSQSLIISSLSVLTTACVGETATTSTNSPNTDYDSLKATASNIPPAQASINSSPVMHILQKDLSTSSTNEANLTATQTLPSTIGWDSVNNRQAPMNCWIYNEQITDSGTSSSIGVAYNANAASSALNISNSAGAKFAFFSSSASFDYSTLSQSSSQSVNAFALAGGTATARFQITGLQPWAKSLYESNPDSFTQQCGDQVLSALPVKNQLVAGMSFYTQSSSFNQSENNKLSGSFSIASVARDVATQNSTASTQTSIAINWITMGQYDTKLFNQAQLQIQNCLALNGSDSTSTCTNAFTTMSAAATSAFTNNVSLANAIPSQPLWANYFVVDYSRPNAFTTISGKMALQQIGVLNPVDSNPAFKPYKSIIQHNVNVLQDLQLANSIFKNNIGPAFKQFLAVDNQKRFIVDNANLGQLYTTGLTSSVQGLSNRIQNCLASTDRNSINTNCSLLNPNETVSNVINTYFTSPFAANINGLLSTAIQTSVQGLIYDTVTSGFAFSSNPKGTTPPDTTLSGFIGYSIWVPNSGGRADIVTVPNIKSSNITATGFNIKTVKPFTYSNAFAIFDENVNLNGEFYFPERNEAGFVGSWTGLPNQPSTLISRGSTGTSVSNSPAYKGQICIPFSANSAGCTYNYTIYMGTFFGSTGGYTANSGVFPEQFTVRDNYQIGQASLFSTLYPWAPDPAISLAGEDLAQSGSDI